MDATNSNDKHWQAAMDWVLRLHDNELQGAVPEALQAELATWLRADPGHRPAFEEASRVWLITGMVPPQAG